MLLKKGDPNYQRITGLLRLYQSYTSCSAKIIGARIKHILLEAQTVDQAGFRPGFSCDDRLFAISLVAEKLNEFNQPLWIAVLDFQKVLTPLIIHLFGKPWRSSRYHPST